MSLEPWPPRHKRPEFRKRLIRMIVLGILIVLVITNLVRAGEVD